MCVCFWLKFFLKLVNFCKLKPFFRPKNISAIKKSFQWYSPGPFLFAFPFPLPFRLEFKFRSNIFVKNRFLPFGENVGEYLGCWRHIFIYICRVQKSNQTRLLGWLVGCPFLIGNNWIIGLWMTGICSTSLL